MARNSLINLEEMPDMDVERMKAAFAALASIERPMRRPVDLTTQGSGHKVELD